MPFEITAFEHTYNGQHSLFAHIMYKKLSTKRNVDIFVFDTQT